MRAGASLQHRGTPHSLIIPNSALHLFERLFSGVYVNLGPGGPRRGASPNVILMMLLLGGDLTCKFTLGARGIVSGGRRIVVARRHSVKSRRSRRVGLLRVVCYCNDAGVANASLDSRSQVKLREKATKR